MPISFLEAFSFGVCVVSNQNPDNLTQKFGVYVGHSIGDGFDDVYKYVEAINNLLSNEAALKDKSFAAYEYIRKVHSVENFNKLLSFIIETD